SSTPSAAANGTPASCRQSLRNHDMLIKNNVIDQIKAGQITLIFRRWKKPGVKAGGTQLTQRGVLAVDAIVVVSENQITEKDAKAAGFDSREKLLAQMYDREGEETDIYRIQ